MAKAKKFIPCHTKTLTPARQRIAAERAKEEDPARWPSSKITPAFLTVDIKRWWGDKPREFSVGFMDSASAAHRKRIVDHGNGWAEYCNKSFRETSNVNDADVRIAFGNDGLWSYVGIDNGGVDRNQPTMNLVGFNRTQPESEYRRGVRHEFGHFLGFEHEHLRDEIVSKIIRAKAYAYFWANQRWPRSVVDINVLVALDKLSIRGTPEADDMSVMAYQLPGSIMSDGKPVRGGTDINATDAAFIATLYPKIVVPLPPPPTGPDGEGAITIGGMKYKLIATKVA